MQLGAFSVSLAVKDLQASKAFYEKLGFRALMADHPPDWVILKNGDHIVGLFQGMFEKNMLTFNPGWDQGAQNLDDFETGYRQFLNQRVAAFVATLCSRRITPKSACTHWSLSCIAGLQSPVNPCAQN